MAFHNGVDAYLNGLALKLDRNAPEEIQRPTYRHQVRSLFRPGTDITGVPGARNLREERLIQHITNWNGGEGQVVLPSDDPDGGSKRFFRSEGIDFRVPGQATLNKSSIPGGVPDGTATSVTEIEGSSFSDVTGTSVVVNTTDRRLSLTTGPDIIESSSFTPGAVQAQTRVWLYKEAVQTTSVDGSSFTVRNEPAATSGTDMILKNPGAWVSYTLSGLGTDPYAVTLSAAASGSSTQYTVDLVATILDTTGNNSTVVASAVGSLRSFAETMTFTPQTGHTYQVRFYWTAQNGGATKVTLDYMTHGKFDQPTSVTVYARNHTDGNTSGLPSKTIQLQNTSSAQLVTLNWTATAAKAYRVRVRYNSGVQRPIVDKMDHNAQSTGAWILDHMELGQFGYVWLAGHQGSGDNQLWSYNFALEKWNLENALTTISATASASIGMAHSDTYQYILDVGGEISRATLSAELAYTDARAGAVGIAICQNRLFVLKEHASNGVDIEVFPVDGAGSFTSSTSGYQAVEVASALVTPDTTLRQRIVGTPTGARFFVNYSGVTSVIYESDTSGSTLTCREIARLDVGAKASAITYVAGLTFIAGSFLAETGQTARSALWVIDQNGVLRRIGYFRRDDPDSNRVQYMQPYQNDLWCLQGPYVWRYSLATGGLFLEYELSPGLASNAKSLAVVQGHVIVLYSSEDATNTGGVTWVTGSVDTYRQASVEDGNTVTSSIFDYGLPAVKKMLAKVQVITDDMPADTAVRVEYQADQDGEWVEVGTHTSGTETPFYISEPNNPIDFRTLQIRTSLSSSTGDDTPTLKAVVVEALPSEFEEFFELMVLTEDEDSSFHVDGQERSGGDVSQAIQGLWKTGAPVTFEDGMQHSAIGNNPTYLCRIDDFDATNDQIGEGRMMVRLRVLG
jgi:hypothetical protein